MKRPSISGRYELERRLGVRIPYHRASLELVDGVWRVTLELRMQDVSSSHGVARATGEARELEAATDMARVLLDAELS